MWCHSYKSYRRWNVICIHFYCSSLYYFIWLYHMIHVYTLRYFSTHVNPALSMWVETHVGVTNWLYALVTVYPCNCWPCGSVTMWRGNQMIVCPCDCVSMWGCNNVAVYPCEGVTMWGCNHVIVCSCVDVTMWLCIHMRVCQYDCVTMWGCNRVMV